MPSFTGLDEDAALLQHRIERFHSAREQILKQVRVVIVGQDEAIEQIVNIYQMHLTGMSAPRRTRPATARENTVLKLSLISPA